MNFADQWRVLMDARNTLPVQVETLPEKLGIKLKYAYLAEGISGMLERFGDTFLITVCATDSPTRQRFTLAHELGHYMIHRHLVGEGIDDDKAYRSTEAGKYHNMLIGPAEETDANRFAVNLLMPKHLIKSEREKKGNDVNSMARLFGVSRQAMEIRLGRPD